MEFNCVDIKQFSGYSYTPKYIYRDKTLSLKAKGLMSLFFSLPENWSFSEAGLAAINNDGIASVKSTIKELKEKNYLITERKRDANGRLGETRFIFFQTPNNVPENSVQQEFTEYQSEDNNSNIKVEDVPVSIMSNYHLRDKNLSLKAKGLLCLMFSLPSNWIFSEKNLTQLSADGMSGVRAAVQELKETRYLKIEQQRNEKGYLGRSIYYFYRMPYDIDRRTYLPEVEIPHTDTPHTDMPHADKPLVENPTVEKPCVVNRGQIKTISTKTNSNKNAAYQIPHLQNTENSGSKESRAEMRKKIKREIRYDFILSQNDAQLERLETEEVNIEELDAKMVNISILEKLIDTLVDVYMTEEAEIQAGQNRTVSKYRIIEKFQRMRLSDIKEIINRVEDAQPKNTRGYILTVLSNY